MFGSTKTPPNDTASMKGKPRTNIPIIKPPDENHKYEIHNKGRVIIKSIMILLMVIPAVLYAVFKSIFPGPGKSLMKKVTVVTGAGRGLGRTLAIKLAREGCKVACVDINEVMVKETAAIITKEGYTALPYVTNVAKTEDIAKLAANVTKDFGPVDILLNNAALIVGLPFLDITDKEVEGIVSVNFLSHFWMIKAFLPSMKERNSGHIVGISSVSSLNQSENISTYAACKCGVYGLMDNLREELRATKGNEIQVTTVLPYFINTSQDYTTHWKITIPELTIDAVADPIINGIKHNKRTITIPEHLYFLLTFLRLLPWSIRDLVSDTFVVKVLPVADSEREKFPVLAILGDTLATSSS